MAGNAPANSVATENDAKSPESGVAFSLDNILGDNHDKLEHPGLKQQELDALATAAEGWDEESANRPAAEGFCVECEGKSVPRVRRSFDESALADQPAQLSCTECEDDYCEVCFAAQHRKGTRKRHTVTPISGSSQGRRAYRAGTTDGEGKKGEVTGVCASQCSCTFLIRVHTPGRCRRRDGRRFGYRARPDCCQAHHGTIHGATRRSASHRYCCR